MEKSYVSLEAKVCPVCGKQHQSGGILLDKRLKNSLEKETVTGYELCKEHQDLYDKGFIALVVCDEKKSNPSNGKMKAQDAYRTGEVIHMREFAARDLMNIPKGEKVPVLAFISEEAAKMIKERVENEDSGDATN